jgi:NAD+ synthase
MEGLIMSAIDEYKRYMGAFNAAEVTEKIIEWIRDWFEQNGKGCNAVIGISGGKDSTVAAALCVKALGIDRVYGLLMPNGEQQDIFDSYEVHKTLGIQHYYNDIEDPVEYILQMVKYDLGEASEQSRINLPPRIRMCYLYAYSQSLNGRVTNTCNLSEDYVGYSTKYGDAAGDFAPLKSLTSDEVIAVGRVLGLPEHLLTKAPSDGLCGKTDEENLGFSYQTLNCYIRLNKIDDLEAKEKIDRLHRINSFKERVIDRFEME